MSAEKKNQMAAAGRLVIEDGTEIREPDPAVAEADLEVAVAEGRLDEDGNPTDATANPSSVEMNGDEQ